MWVVSKLPRRSWKTRKKAKDSHLPFVEGRSIIPKRRFSPPAARKTPSTTRLLCIPPISTSEHNHRNLWQMTQTNQHKAHVNRFSNKRAINHSFHKNSTIGRSECSIYWAVAFSPQRKTQRSQITKSANVTCIWLHRFKSFKLHGTLLFIVREAVGE